MGLAPSVVRIVCGPPSSGKTTYVKTNAKAGDIIWDFDAVSRSIVHKTGSDRNVATIGMANKMRDAFLQEVHKQVSEKTLMNDVWVTWGLPNVETRRKLATALKAEVIVIEASPDLCREQGNKRGGEEEGVRMFRDANRWWSRYDRHEKDIIVTE